MIGIGITTRNRPEVLANSLIKHDKFLPPSSNIVIVDDSSDIPVPGATYRFDERAGIPRAKNKCLELLQDCDHIFLFDDDCYPIVKDWWKPYVDHMEPHLMYIFTGFGNQTKGIKEIYRDETTVAYDHVRGCMLYVDRRVLDVIGGFDTTYGIGMYEHTDWTNRIFNAGLTTHRVMDVPDSNKLIHSMDEYQEVMPTFTTEERQQQIRRNRRIKMQNSGKTSYKDFIS